MAFNTEDNRDIINSGFITSSRGLPANDAFGELFKGVAEGMTNVLRSQDQATLTQIDITANASVNDLAEKNTPPAVTDGISKIQALKTAKDQGMDEASFNQRLLSEVKRIKSSVPQGYWADVDRAVASAQGSSTADQLRRSRLSALEADARAAESQLSEDEKAKNAYYDGNEEFLMSEQGLDAYKRLFKKDFTPATASLREMQVIAGLGKADKANRERLKAEAEVDEKSAAKNAGKYVWSKTNEVMSAANPLFNQFRQKFDQLNSDGKLSDQEIAELAPMWQTFKAYARRTVAADLTSQEFAANLGTKGVADALAPMDARLAAWEELFNSPTAANLKLLQDSIALTTATKENELLQNDTVAWYVAALKTGIWKQEDLDVFLREITPPSGEGSMKDELDNQFKNVITLGLVTGNLELGESLDKAGPEASKNAKIAIIDSGMKQIENATTPDQVAKVAGAIFNRSLDDTLEKYAGTTENRVKLFEKFVNPKVAEKILASEGKQAYIDWANKQMRIMLAESGDLVIDAQQSSDWAKITFDGKQLQLDRIGGFNPMGTNPWEAWKYRKASQAVENFNKYLRLMDPIWAAEYGKDYPADILVQKMIGADINKIAKDGSLLTRMIEGIGDWVSNPDVDYSRPNPATKPRSDAGGGYSKVVAAGAGWTAVEGPDGTQKIRQGSRNWRNNNPGNIEYGPFAKAQGAIGTDGRFAVFPNYDAGRAAKANLLFESKGYRNKTLAQAINRYAPPTENNTQGYINAVAEAVGVNPNTPISELTPSQRELMLDAMEKVEGFKVGQEYDVAET